MPLDVTQAIGVAGDAGCFVPSVRTTMTVSCTDWAGAIVSGPMISMADTPGAVGEVGSTLAGSLQASAMNAINPTARIILRIGLLRFLPSARRPAYHALCGHELGAVDPRTVNVPKSWIGHDRLTVRRPN